MKLRVTENRCVLFNSLTYVYLALLPQHWALYAKVDSTPTLIYIYIYLIRGSKLGLFWLVAMASRKKTFGNEFWSKFATNNSFQFKKPKGMFDSLVSSCNILNYISSKGKARLTFIWNRMSYWPHFLSLSNFYWLRFYLWWPCDDFRSQNSWAQISVKFFN